MSSPDVRPLRFAYTDTRRWVMIGAAIGTVAYLTLTLANVAMWGWDPQRHRLIVLLAGLGCGAGCIAAQRGRVLAGGVIALSAVWCESQSSLVLSSEFAAPALFATAVIVVARALLLTPRQSAILAFGSIIATWPLVLLSPAVRAFVDVVRKERALSETIDRLPDGILVIDAHELLQVINPAAGCMLGVDRDECIGRPMPSPATPPRTARRWPAAGAARCLRACARRTAAPRDGAAARACPATRSRGPAGWGLAHDLNNILTIIGASAEVLRDEAPDESLAPRIDEILAAQDRGATTTRQLLAFARREVVQPRVVDIFVRMTKDDGGPRVRLRVRDEGAGMNAATIARAFEPFFTTKSRGRGTGLGLAAVHGMALQRGGRATIELQPLVGTTVPLEFPSSSAPATAVTARTTAEHPRIGGTILVTEDDDGTRASVARLLERLGYAVLLASDGIQALRMAQVHAGQIDLLLTDVTMPGLSGSQLAAQQHRRAPHVSVICMSGYPEDALADGPGLRLETDVVAKPFASATPARRIAGKIGIAMAASPEG